VAGNDDGPKISAKDQARVRRASVQLPAYANFLRWSGNFAKGEISRHPRHDQVYLLSVMQSGLFSWVKDHDTLLIGAQPHEATWMLNMPFDAAYVSDRLYLSVGSVEAGTAKLPLVALGLFCDDRLWLQEMRSCQRIQIVPVEVVDGQVVDVGRATGLGFDMKSGDIIDALFRVEKERLKSQDLGRFF